MPKTVCNMVTPAVEKIAKQFGKSAALTNIIISAWQTENQTLEYPTVKQLKDYYNRRHQQQSSELESTMRIQRSKDMEKLTRDFNPFTLHDRAAMLARDFSEIVDEGVQTELQKIEADIAEEGSKENPSQTEIDRLLTKKAEYESTQGRQAVIRDMTVKTIFDRIAEKYESYVGMSEEELDEDFGEGRGAYMLAEYRKVLDNLPALLNEACSLLENIEHLRVITDYHTYNNGETTTEVIGGTIQESSDIEEDNENQFSDDEEGTRATGNDGWSFQVRFIDPYTTLSKGVKTALSNIVRVDHDGNVDTDDLGNTRYLNPEYTHVALLNSMSSIVDPDDFSIRHEDGSYTFPALERARVKYPWISQVINALQTDPTLIGSFYADLRKDFISYCHQYRNEKDVLVTHFLNQNTAVESSLNAAQNNYTERQLLDTDSLYDKAGSINQESADKGLKLVAEVLRLTRDFTEDDTSNISDNTSKLLKMLGFDVSKSAVSNLLLSTDGIISVETIVNSARNILSQAKKVNPDTNIFEQFDADYKVIAEKIGVVEELDNVASFRQGDKTRYSYSTPNYVDTMIKLFKDDNRREEYLESEFGRFEWFKKNGRWKSGWLQQIEENEDVRNHMATKELIDIEGVEYKSWTPSLIRKAFVNEYFSQGTNKGSSIQYAYYNMPIFSDSPVVKFIRFVRYTGAYKKKLIPLFRDVVKQELYRINLVKNRRANGVPEIQNFDKNGDKFHFFPELNDILDDDFKNSAHELLAQDRYEELFDLLTTIGNNSNGNSYTDLARQAYQDGKSIEGIIDSISGVFQKRAEVLIVQQTLTGLNDLIDNNVVKIMNSLFADFVSKQRMVDTTIHTANLLNLGVIQDKSQAEEALEEYFWNQAYATTQIIELTTTDLAYYKDDVDFQKRFKEVYASGTKLNTNTKYGKKIRRTAYIADNIITSTTFTDIKKVLDNAVAQKRIQTFDRDNILNKFKDVNEADAQAYITPQAMRSVLDMMGAWTDAMEESFQRFENGEWDMSDFNTLWQTIKPFVYTQISKPDGVTGNNMKVPHQNKNSEYLLLAAYQMIGSATSQSPQLRAIQRFMKDNDIDVIQFQSAVKAGGQGIININYSPTELEKALTQEILDAAKKDLKNKFEAASNIDKFKAGNDYLLEHSLISQEEYNDRFKNIAPTESETYAILDSNTKANGSFRPEVIHEIPYRDYVIQQPTPEHLTDTTAVYGSQLRNLIIADLPEDFKTVINDVALDKKQIVTLYNSLIVENLIEDFTKVTGRFEDIYTLQKALLRQVSGNTKYSRDMVNALQIVEVINPLTRQKEQVFNMPFSNPSMTLKMQELINAMFKNGITKQHIKGGNAMLVSSFGLTQELNLVYEGEGQNKHLAGIECYLPASSRKFYEPFMNTSADGTYQYLDVNKMPKELKKLVGYRIPTEDKYSMAPLIVKGFLPQQNGSAIMLPADITQIAGSDFDVDKMFLMIPEFRERKIIDWRSLKRLIMQNEGFKKWGERNIDITLDEIKNGDIAFSEGFPEKAIYDYYAANKVALTTTKIEKVQYNTDKTPQENSREQRNNMLIDIIYGILTHPSISPNILNPGSFDTLKLQARITRIITDPALYDTFRKEFNLNTKEEAINKILQLSREENLEVLDGFLKKYKTARSQLTLETFIYNHVQNMTGAALIGMYANNTTAQAKYQYSNLRLKDDFTYTINGRKIQSLHDMISPLGERISRNCAQFSAASVDNVKDPVLADLLQNPNTARVTAFMLRAGMSLEEITLMYAQPIVRDSLIANGSFAILNKDIKDAISVLKDNGGGVDAQIRQHDFTSRELLDNVLSQYDLLNIEESNKRLAKNIQAALLMSHIASLADALAELTQISRADSPNGAILNNLAGSKVQVSRVSRFNDRAESKKFPLEGISEAIKNDIVNVDDTPDKLREALLKRRMPMLQTFYSLGIELGTKIVGKYFQQVNPSSDQMLEFIMSNAPNDFLSNRKQKTATSVVNSFYKDLVNYALSDTQIFGDEASSDVVEEQPSLPNASTVINIWWGSGEKDSNRENADLSNFAIRPFKYEFSDGSYEEFKSVEQAFQYFKIKDNFLSTEPGQKELLFKILQTTSGASLRNLGRKMTMSNQKREQWDSVSSKKMKKLIKLSFEQNPQALQRLLATGNATLTHTQDRSKWSTEFPRILMEVREELRNEHSELMPQSMQQVPQSNVVFSKKWTDHWNEVGTTDASTAAIDVSKAEFYSGNATGSDREWKTQANALGIKVVDYEPKDFVALPVAWKNKLDNEYKIIARALGRPILEINNYRGQLVRRNMMQADKADAIFAIGTIASNGFVDGGTAYATTRGIQRDIPVYVFDQSVNKWKVWSKENRSFVETDTPTLTQNAAVIGTREITDAGKKAIIEVLNNTLGTDAKPLTTSSRPRTFEEKRDYYLNEYPQKFLEVKEKNPELAKIGIIQKLTVKNNKLVLYRSGRLRTQARDSFMRDLDSLLYLGEEGIRMAHDLFMYSYYKEGFWFGPNSFGNFFSTNFFNTFPEVMESLRYMGEKLKDRIFADRFLTQFYAIHYNDGMVPVVEDSEDEKDEKAIKKGSDGTLFIPAEKCFNNTTQKGYYQHIVYEGKLYELSNSAGGKVTYNPVTTLNAIKYNAKMSVDELKQFDEEDASDLDFLDYFDNNTSLGDYEAKKSKRRTSSNTSDDTDLSFDLQELEGKLDGFDAYLDMFETYNELGGNETLDEFMC